MKRLALKSDRMPLINALFGRNGPSAATFSIRPYLTTPITEDVRKSFCQLMAGDHPLAVGALRGMPAKQKVQRERRICRFCHKKEVAEDEGHLIVRCEDPHMIALRTEQSEISKMDIFVWVRGCTDMRWGLP